MEALFISNPNRSRPSSLHLLLSLPNLFTKSATRIKTTPTIFRYVALPLLFCFGYLNISPISIEENDQGENSCGDWGEFFFRRLDHVSFLRLVFFTGRKKHNHLILLSTLHDDTDTDTQIRLICNRVLPRRHLRETNATRTFHGGNLQKQNAKS